MSRLPQEVQVLAREHDCRFFGISVRDMTDDELRATVVWLVRQHASDRNRIQQLEVESLRALQSLAGR